MKVSSHNPKVVPSYTRGVGSGGDNEKLVASKGKAGSPVQGDAVSLQGPQGKHQDLSSQKVAFASIQRGGAPYYDEAADKRAIQAYYGGMVESFETASSKEIYHMLHGKLSSTHSPLDYKPSRYLYPVVDRHPDGKLYGIYSGDGPKSRADMENPNFDRGRSLPGGTYNCEHTVPQSWFGKRPNMRGDLHILFAEDRDCNSARANFPVNDEAKSGRKIDNCGIADGRSRNFTPEGGKGALARAVLYFLVAHPGYIGDKEVEYQPSDVAKLVEWAKEDPPTEYEMHRNAEIEKLQGNRNPFIDFPELVSKVDFEDGFASRRGGRRSSKGIASLKGNEPSWNLA